MNIDEGELRVLLVVSKDERVSASKDVSEC